MFVYQNVQLSNNTVKIKQILTNNNSTVSLPSAIDSSTPTVSKNKVECYENDKYYLTINPLSGDFLVKYKTGNKRIYNCIYKVDASDFEINNEGADWYYGLENDFLFIDEGTGPPPRGLKVYDLIKRLKIYSGSYNTPTNISNNSIEFWKEVSIKVTRENCSDKDKWESGGLGTAIEEHVRLDLVSLKETSLNEFRCSPRQ